MRIAIEGCAHGELEVIYETIKLFEEVEKVTVDLLIICGDFQTCRNEEDLHCMAVPPKYYNMRSFYKYYNGEKVAPILTIFIGGNHEASNYLQELPYGGWVAPKIYYLGYAGVVNVAGIKIAGLSGIYKGHDYLKGRYEKTPYTNETKRSVYHIRNLDVFRLKQLSQPLDIFVSHDWPTNIWNYGNLDQLLRFKPYFKSDIETEKLGSKPCEDLLMELQPKYYFAAHLHCKFAAMIKHKTKNTTKFVALDKCLPKRRFLQFIEIPHDANEKIQLEYDLEWLTVLFLTNHLISVKSSINYLPSSTSTERWQFRPTAEEKALVLKKLENNLVVPENFEKTAVGHDVENLMKIVKQPQPKINSQTTLFCNALSVDDPLNLLGALENNLDVSSNDDSTSTEEDEDLYETFIKNTPLKLNLPKPKYDVNNDSFEISAICDSTSLLSNESFTVKAEDEVSPSDAKKFKRRNASLYCSENANS
ncbi:hypothetical protein FQA39_LY07736 [Lamprigera yunnana]|nr:hypothetical protein FQA39_LY07736 [Lamprigera yunnana]